jgi:hypothetical protein
MNCSLKEGKEQRVINRIIDRIISLKTIITLERKEDERRDE